jgi:hypothetical protein
MYTAYSPRGSVAMGPDAGQSVLFAYPGNAAAPAHHMPSPAATPTGALPGYATGDDAAGFTGAASSSSGGPSATHGDRYKTKLCENWTASMGKYCRFGTRCWFAHGPGELRPVRQAARVKGDAAPSSPRSAPPPQGRSSDSPPSGFGAPHAPAHAAAEPPHEQARTMIVQVVCCCGSHCDQLDWETYRRLKDSAEAELRRLNSLAHAAPHTPGPAPRTLARSHVHGLSLHMQHAVGGSGGAVSSPAGGVHSATCAKLPPAAPQSYSAAADWMWTPSFGYVDEDSNPEMLRPRSQTTSSSASSASSSSTFMSLFHNGVSEDGQESKEWSNSPTPDARQQELLPTSLLDN